MSKKGLLLMCSIFALVFVPGTIPTYLGIKTAKLRKKTSQKNYVKG